MTDICSLVRQLYADNKQPMSLPMEVKTVFLKKIVAQNTFIWYNTPYNKDSMGYDAHF